MTQEQIDLIHRSTKGSLDGTLSFPEVVGNLISAGVCFYHIDLFRAEKTCYVQNGENLVESISIPSIEIGHIFDAAAVAAAVKSSQTEGQPFPEFLRRAMLGGCVGYFAYLDGRKVVYLGRLGDEHVEHFPQ